MSRNVVIAGGGVAAVEAALGLRELAGELELTLLAPNRAFELAPGTVAEVAGGPPALRFDLHAIAADLGVEVIEDTLDGVETGKGRVLTGSGRTVAYDGLLLALGALPGPVLPGALRFGGRRDVASLRAALDRVERLARPRIAFVATGGVGWTLPLYELALLVAARLDARARPREITIVTPEGEPLGLFGHAASHQVARRLADHRIALRINTPAESVEGGALRLAADEPLPADLVVALPELVGPGVPGLPADADGFVPVDRYGRVHGLPNVWAAGDITSRPLKQGGLAAQQADSAATSIAAWLGAPVAPQPYQPVLHGALLTGDVPQFLRRAEPRSGTTDAPHWAPSGKLAGRRLGPYLATHPEFAFGIATSAG